MTGSEVVAALRALDVRFRTEEERLNGLDRALGDGDHGATMARGFAVVVADLPSDTRDTEAGAILTQAGRDFLRATGGASGNLFSALFREVGIHCGHTLDAAGLRNGLSAATDRVMRVGKASPGDKTMVDALAPARVALDEDDGTMSLRDALSAAANAAEDGAARTTDMTARRGRARYVEDGGRGHVDPGAISVALILRTLAEHAERTS